MADPKLSPAQVKVLERLAAGEGLYSMQPWGGGRMYYRFVNGGGHPMVVAPTMDKLRDLNLVRAQYKMGTGSSDFFITDAGREALAKAKAAQ